MFDEVASINTEKLASFMASLQNEDGSFSGDYGGEIDARFSYCAVSALSLLGKMDLINKDKARDFILRCKNMDGSFGGVPDAESHAAYAFCTIGTLKILGEEELVDRDKLGMWLSKR
jgi:geranylgeranyl transferase type-2 subunit beta